MPLAFCKSSPGQSAIDAEKGIITGVKVMEVGMLAHFANSDGESQSVKITPAHIDALLAHAGNRGIPIHSTHEWHYSQKEPNADSIEMAARIGALKAFRKDDAGNLIADAYFKDNAKADICWAAEHNPEDTMLSAVFGYRKDDPQCMPTDFRAADIVPMGASTTALFSAEPKTTMDIQELITLLDDPKAKDAIKAIVKSHQDAPDPKDETAGAAMESDAGVTDADKKDSDSQAPALMRATIRAGRATLRKANEQIATLRADRAAILADAKRDAEAQTTALLGKSGKFVPANGGNEGSDFEAKIATHLAALPDGKKDRSVAILRARRDNPELYNAAKSAGKL